MTDVPMQTTVLMGAAPVAVVVTGKKKHSILPLVVAGGILLLSMAAFPLWIIETFIWAAKI